ncbi:MliC family protein [Pseudoalteromonas maricaloris]|uniref:MliC family protein n=1 Tax=Pseudoalteromonas maricaloris TaxID=184924 RepID=UPI003C2980C1
MKSQIAFAVLISAVLSACGEDISNRKIELSETLSRYQCDNDSVIKVDYNDSDKATVHFNEQVVKMKIARSASGAKYQGDGFVWWTKNDEGMLLRQEEGKNNRIIARCEMRPNKALTVKAQSN